VTTGHLAEGDTVKRCTGRILEVPGRSRAARPRRRRARQPDRRQGPDRTPTETTPIEKIAPGVIARQSVDQPVQTGLKAIDAMVPVGRGQRELIIGDRQIGKTAVAIDAIINQKGKGITCIYVAVGQKMSTIANVVASSKSTAHGAHDRRCAPRRTPAAMQFIAPYAGCTMGEYFRGSTAKTR
jgi:F-type H+-transporting ATPase subunit alpha